MAVSMADITKLRKMTGAGMMDCKNALTEAEGDFDKAFLQSIIPAPVILRSLVISAIVTAIIYFLFIINIQNDRMVR